MHDIVQVAVIIVYLAIIATIAAKPAVVNSIGSTFVNSIKAAKGA